MSARGDTFTLMTPDGDGQQGDSNNPTGVERLLRLHIWQIQAVRDLLFVAAVLAIFWMGYALRAVTVPLLVALLLAYLFEPVIRWLCRPRLLNRVRAVSLLLAGGILSVVIILAIALPLAISQTTRFIDDVQSGELRANVARLGAYVPEQYHQQFEDVLDLLPGDAGAAEPEVDIAPDEDQATDGMDGENDPDAATDETASDSPGTRSDMDVRQLEQIIDERIAVFDAQRRAEAAAAAADERNPTDWVQIAQRGAQTIFDVIGFIVSLGLLAFLIPFYFFFFSLWYPKVLSFGERFIPQKNKSRVLHLLKKMDLVVAGFVRGRIVISLIMGVLLAIGWMICGVPYAIPLGIIVGIFCAVPYLGVVGIPAAIALLFFDQLGVEESQRMAWWGILLWPSLVFAIVQVIEGYLLTPMIAGKATNLDPVTILVAVLAGGSVLGVYGMLLAIPLAACGKIMVMDVLMPKVHDWTEGRAEDPLPIERE